MPNPTRPASGAEVMASSWGRAVADTVVRRYPSAEDRNAELDPLPAEQGQLAAYNAGVLPGMLQVKGPPRFGTSPPDPLTSRWWNIAGGAQRTVLNPAGQLDLDCTGLRVVDGLVLSTLSSNVSEIRLDATIDNIDTTTPADIVFTVQFVDDPTTYTAWIFRVMQGPGTPLYGRQSVAVIDYGNSLAGALPVTFGVMMRGGWISYGGAAGPAVFSSRPAPWMIRQG